MTDYKHTLNLPSTDFPMQAQLAKREPEILARWEADDVYGQAMKSAEGRPMYWLIDGPPYANGDIHIGHVVNKVLKDIVVKVARLDGHCAPYIPGWDCHGLPIELQVEKKHGKVGEKLDAKTFRDKCRAYAEEQIDRQRLDFKRLGVLGDWERPYLTMRPQYEAEQLRALARIIERGHVVRGAKPVHWCLDCGSSLAEAEVEYQDKTSPAVDVKFRAVDSAEVAKRFGVKARDDISLVIWTTTPWTLPANQAVAIHPRIDYALVETAGHGALVLAEALVQDTAARLGESPKVLATASGEALAGLKARHPFADREVPVILGDHVTLDTGTGLVHTAPAHGLEDYVAGQANNLPVDNPIGADGKFSESTPIVGGMHVRKADAPIIEGLKTRGALAHKADIVHSYPHCWRHKTPLIFRATTQWFISMDHKGLRDGALRGIRETNWIPSWGEARIHEMVEGRPDWCISRQRYWGVPLALFVHKDSGALHPRMPELLRKVADRVEREGIEAWFGSGARDWLGDEAEQYQKGTDTLDVWFDSGVVHQCSFASAAPQYLQDGVAPVADMYLEGSDQHRGWFMSSLLTSVAMHDRAPYKAVLTHGFTVDEQGRKMSKSLGNVIAPQQVTKTLGADILRLWVAASDYSGEIAISDNLLKRISDAYRRIRNTTRYLLGNLHGFDPQKDAVPVPEMLAMDRWALAQACAMQEQVVAAYRDSQFHLVYHRLHNYCVVELGGLYLDILKDRLYTLPRDSLARRSAQTAMYHLAEALVRWISPVLSFTADEIWRALPGDRSGSVFSQTWHQLPQLSADTSLDWRQLRRVRLATARVLEDLRNRGEIGAGLDAGITIHADGEVLAALRGPGEELRFWFITSEARVRPADERAEKAAEVELEGGGKVWIDAVASSHEKCVRCWHRRPDVGQNDKHPQLCGRCVENVDGPGETRCFF